MGVLGIMRDSVTLVNRTNRDLSVRYDGEDITLHPGDNPGFPLVAVPYAKKQNPLMGSKHPTNPNKYICLVGVKGKDNCDPIPAETLKVADTKLEVVDRDGSFWGRPLRQNVKLLNREYDPFEAMADPGALMGDANGALDTKLG